MTMFQALYGLYNVEVLRTGRKDTGRLVVLIANKTIDEAYYWIGQRKIKQAGSIVIKKRW